MPIKPVSKPTRITTALLTSSLSGAIKVGLHVLVTLVVYAIIIRHSGLKVLGSWVLLQLLVGYGGIVHLGMTPVIVKEIANSVKSGKVSTHVYSLSEALSGAIFIALTLITMLTFLSDAILGLVQTGLDQHVSSMCIWVLSAGVILRLLSALYEAVLTGCNRNYLVHICQIVQILAFAVSFLLLHNGKNVLTTLSLAFTIGYMAETFLVITLVAGINVAYLKASPTLSIVRLRQFKNKVLPYFIVDLALMGREPLLKYAIFIGSGSAGVGLFELANKVPTAIRQAFVLGLNALMPAFVYLARRRLKASIVSLAQLSLRYLVWGSAGALFLYGLNSSHLLEIWLQSVDKELVYLTKLMTFWWIVTSLNVPAWWIGMGLDSGWTNTLVASTHLVYTLALFCLSFCFSFSVFTMAILWVFGGLGMQFLLYTRIDSKTKLIRSIYLTNEFRVILTAFFVFACITAASHSLILAPVLSPKTTVFATICIFYFLVLLFVKRPRHRKLHLTV